jgi:hypothetical protein
MVMPSENIGGIGPNQKIKYYKIMFFSFVVRRYTLEILVGS